VVVDNTVLTPALFHCAGGGGCDSFDRLTALIDWVEHGKAVRTRPLCPYPQVAKYKGTGSIDDAASFACADPN
jgi:feruloyl esterase